MALVHVENFQFAGFQLFRSDVFIGAEEVLQDE